MKYLKILTETFLLLFVFSLPWQTKLILLPAENNFNEISLYFSHLILFIALIFFFLHQILKKKSEAKISKMWYFLGGLELFYFISFFFAQDKLLATYRFVILLMGLALFYLLREGLNKSAYEDSCLNRVRAIYAFIISLFLHASLGIYQFLTQSSFSNKYLGIAMHDPMLAGTSVIETASGRWLRAYGGLDHPNILGGLLVFGLLLTAYLLARKKIINSRIQVYGLLLLFGSYFVFLMALFFTFSRGSWLAYFIGLIVLLISIIKKEDKWVMGRFLVLMFFSILLFILAVFPYKELVQTRFQADSRLEIVSINERSEQVTAAEKLIKKNPIFGIGPGNYIRTLESENIANHSFIQPVHNSFLLLWAENGLLALVSLFLFIFFIIRDGRRQTFSLAIIVSLFVLMLVEHWFFSLPFGILIFFFILGVI